MTTSHRARAVMLAILLAAGRRDRQRRRHADPQPQRLHRPPHQGGHLRFRALRAGAVACQHDGGDARDGAAGVDASWRTGKTDVALGFAARHALLAAVAQGPVTVTAAIPGATGPGTCATTPATLRPLGKKGALRAP